MKINFIVIFLLVATALFAEETEEFDIILPDSLNAAANVELQETNAEVQFPTESVVEIGLLQKVKNEIEKAKKNSDQIYALPFIFHQENFHFKSPYDPKLQIRKLGFTMLPYNVSNLHSFQTYYPFFHTSYQQGFIEFDNFDYWEPPAITEANLGLGDINMNYAAVNYRKGMVFGLPNTAVEAGYLGQDGLWLGSQEKSRIFNLQFYYKNPVGKILFYYCNVSQDISTNKLRNPPFLSSSESIKERQNEFAFKLENKYLTGGIRSAEVKLDSLKNRIYSFLFSQKIEQKNLFLQTDYEYFQQSDADDFSLVTHQNRFDIRKFYTLNYGYYRNQDFYFLNSEIGWRLQPGLAMRLGYEKTGDNNLSLLWQNQRLDAGIEMNLNHARVIFKGGREHIRQQENEFCELNSNFSHSFWGADFRLINWLLWRNTDNFELPVWQIRTQIESVVSLRNNNNLRFAISHIYVSEYGYPTDTAGNLSFNDFMNLDAQIFLEITELFQIGVSAVNILSAEQLFGFPTTEKLKDVHFNVNLRWYFIN